MHRFYSTAIAQNEGFSALAGTHSREAPISQAARSTIVNELLTNMVRAFGRNDSKSGTGRTLSATASAPAFGYDFREADLQSGMSDQGFRLAELRHDSSRVALEGTNKSLKQTARETGFGDEDWRRRVFQRELEVTPVG